MILIVGGAYQGKLEYVKKNFCKEDDKITDFSDVDLASINSFQINDLLSSKVLYHFERLVRYYSHNEEYILDSIKKDIFKDKIIISDDISQGIVPIEKVNRRWREDLGHTMLELSSEAEKVIRIFCGMPHVLK